MICLCFPFIFKAQPKTFYILHNSEMPASCFAITDTGLCVTADALFDGIVQKLKNYYQQRKNGKMEAKGQRYELGDFLIKIGSVSLAGSFKGIVVEVNNSLQKGSLIVFMNDRQVLNNLLLWASFKQMNVCLGG